MTALLSRILVRWRTERRGAESAEWRAVEAEPRHAHRGRGTLRAGPLRARPFDLPARHLPSRHTAQPKSHLRLLEPPPSEGLAAPIAAVEVGESTEAHAIARAEATACEAERRHWLRQADAVLNHIEQDNLEYGANAQARACVVSACYALGVGHGSQWSGEELHAAMMDTAYPAHLVDAHIAEEERVRQGELRQQRAAEFMRAAVFG